MNFVFISLNSWFVSFTLDHPGSKISISVNPERIQFLPEFCMNNPVCIYRNRNFKIQIPVLINRNRTAKITFRFRLTGTGFEVSFRFPAGFSGSGRTLFKFQEKK